MPDQNRFPEEKDRRALEKIRELLEDRAETNWAMPDEYAIRVAQDIAQRAPLDALQAAKRYIDDLRQQNAGVQARVVAAEKRRQELAEHPITNAGPRGLKGFLQRWALSLLNATPFSNFNWIEVNQNGLQIYTPLAPVSQRTVTYEQIRSGAIVLSVDPPVYLDQLLGFLGQFRRNIPVPWGELVVYEPGSGRYIARAIAMWPREKLKEMMDALAQIQIAQQPYQGYKRLPRLRDLLIYYDVHDDENLDDLQDLLSDEAPPPPNRDVIDG
ncbi:MAG: hypothetical protein R3E79_17405 [Caldilineaceae bacterium]